MLQETPHHAAHANVVAEAGHARAQTAKTTDNKVNLHTRLAGSIQRVHDAAVLKLIHFGDDASRLSWLGQFNFVLDQLQKALLHGDRRDQQLQVITLATSTCHVIEQAGQVLGDFRIACQQTNVLVQARGFGIVISRADVSVATNAACFLSNDQRGLGVRLESDNAVGHMHSSVL